MVRGMALGILLLLAVVFILGLLVPINVGF